MGGEIRNWRKIDKRTTLRQFCDNFGTTRRKACSRGAEIKNWRQIGVFRATTWQARRRSSAPGFMKLTWRCLSVVQTGADFALLLHHKPGSNNETLTSYVVPSATCYNPTHPCTARPLRSPACKGSDSGDGVVPQCTYPEMCLSPNRLNSSK